MHVSIKQFSFNKFQQNKKKNINSIAVTGSSSTVAAELQSVRNFEKYHTKYQNKRFC
jgi:hypothetical protein